MMHKESYIEAIKLAEERLAKCKKENDCKGEQFESRIISIFKSKLEILEAKG